MTIAAAGALAAALALSCAVFAAFARHTTTPTERVAHPDRRALADLNWRRPLWQWESPRAGSILAGATVAIATPLPTVAVIAAAAIAPSLVVRSRAGAVRRRARL